MGAHEWSSNILTTLLILIEKIAFFSSVLPSSAANPCLRVSTLCITRHLSVTLTACRVQIVAVNDPPRVRLPGLAFRRPSSVRWPEAEDLELATATPLYVDEDGSLDVSEVSVSGETGRLGVAHDRKSAIRIF